MIEVKKELSKTEKASMGLLLGLFFGLIGAVVLWKGGGHTAAWILWSIGAALVLLYYCAPSMQRPLYLGWMYAVFPIGWTVSHVILGILFYLLITPVGLFMRLIGRDSMCRKLDAEAQTYWVDRGPQRESAGYFKQF